MNYLEPIDFESFKESGGIEYTADVIWGIQLKVLRDPDFIKETKLSKKRKMQQDAKAAKPREIDLVCVKNRFGDASYSCTFEYHQQYDFFDGDF